MKFIVIFFTLSNFLSLSFAGDLSSEDDSSEEQITGFLRVMEPDDQENPSVALPDLSDYSLLTLIGNPLNRFPHELCASSKLTVVILINCPMGDIIPEEFWCHREFESLDFVNCKITGTLPPRIGKLHKLKRLNLRNNQLSGPIPTNVVKLLELEELILSENQFSSIPDLCSLRNLTHLDCSHNQIKGLLPPIPTKLKKLYLGNNQFEGSLRVIFKAHDLEVIELEHNNLTGLFNGMEHLHQLKTLNVSDNPLHMLFPKELLALYQLQSLEMSDVGLKGSIPDELCQLTNLVLVRLDRNYLEGTIPKNMRDLHSLQYLALNTNRLTGKLPTFAPALKGLVVENNDLEGSFDVSDFPDLTRMGNFLVKSPPHRVYAVQFLHLTDEILVHFLNLQKEVNEISIELMDGETCVGLLYCNYNHPNERRQLIFHHSEANEKERIESIKAIVDVTNRHLGKKKCVIDIDSTEFIN